MIGEKEENSPGEKEKSEEKTGKIAHCLNCTNEWIPRDQGNKKRKCPVCGKYRVIWKDELVENTPDSSISPGENTGEKGEKEENSPKEKEKLQEKTEEKFEEPEIDEILPNSPDESEDKNEEEKLKEAMEKSGGCPLFAVFAIILGLGILAAGGWFLSRRGKRKRSQISGRPEESKERELEPLFSQIQKANAVRRIY